MPRRLRRADDRRRAACGSRNASHRVGHADQQRADERALDRADAADDDDDEGEDQHRLAHADLHRLQRADQAPARPASAAPSANTTV